MASGTLIHELSFGAIGAGRQESTRRRSILQAGAPERAGRAAGPADERPIENLPGRGPGLIWGDT